MSRLKFIVYFILIYFSFFSLPKITSSVFAAEDCLQKPDFRFSSDPETINQNAEEARIILKGVEPGSYQLRIGWGLKPGEEDLTKAAVATTSQVNLIVDKQHNKLTDLGIHPATVMKDGKEYCGNLFYAISPANVSCSVDPSTVDYDKPFLFKASGLKPDTSYRLVFNKDITIPGLTQIKPNNTGNVETSVDIQNLYAGLSHAILRLYDNAGSQRGKEICVTQLSIGKKFEDEAKTAKWYRCEGGRGKCTEYSEYVPNSTTDQNACDKACSSEGATFTQPKNLLPSKDSSLAGGSACDIRDGKPLYSPPRKRTDTNPAKFYSDDKTTIEVESKYAGVLTAIGCVPTQPRDLVNGLVRFMSLASGGIALILMTLAVLKWLTAMGNPENLNNARDQFFSALIGLLFIVFSVLLLQIIGVDVLGLPGFKA